MKKQEDMVMDVRESKELSFDTKNFPKEVWVFDTDNLDQGTEISHLMMSHAEEYTKDELLVICRKAAMVIDQLRTDLAKAQAVPEWGVVVPKLSANYLFNKVHELGFKHQDEKDTVLYHLNYMASGFRESAKQFVEDDHAKQKAMIEEQDPAND